jgi:hypothetical protein
MPQKLTSVPVTQALIMKNYKNTKLYLKMFLPLNIESIISANTQLKHQKLKHRRIGCVLIGCFATPEIQFSESGKKCCSLIVGLQ